jgi:hypothetical protein
MLVVTCLDLKPFDSGALHIYIHGDEFIEHLLSSTCALCDCKARTAASKDFTDGRQILDALKRVSGLKVT